MRRLISILLLAVFGLPFALPMFALGQDADSGLPACCRRNGKHHCSMGMEAHRQFASQEPQFQAPVDKCPCTPFAGSLLQPNPLAGPLDVNGIAGDLLATHPLCVAQTEARGRISRDRSHGKRGPPTLTSL